MKKFFKLIGQFFHKLFDGAKRFEKFLNEHVDDALEIANKIRAALTSSEVLTLLDLLPEKYQNAAEDVQRKVLDQLERAVIKLNLSNDCLQKATLLEKVQCMIEVLKQRSEMDANGNIQKLATAFLMENDERQVSEHIADTIILTRLTDKKNPDAIADADGFDDADDDKEAAQIQEETGSTTEEN